MTEITIRQIEKEDWKQLIDLRIAFLKELGHSVNYDACHAQMNTYLTDHLNQSVTVLGAFDGAKMVGCAYLLFQDRPYHDSFAHGKIGEVVNVYTLPDYRRQGIAGQMMDAIIAIAKERGLDQLRLNASQAGRGVYEQKGFVDNPPKDPPMVLPL